jgi:hypothetical protein
LCHAKRPQDAAVHVHEAWSGGGLGARFPGLRRVMLLFRYDHRMAFAHAVAIGRVWECSTLASHCSWAAGAGGESTVEAGMTLGQTSLQIFPNLPVKHSDGAKLRHGREREMRTPETAA